MYDKILEFQFFADSFFTFIFFFYEVLVPFESARHAPSIAPIFSKIWPMEKDKIIYENDFVKFLCNHSLIEIIVTGGG